MALGVNQVGTTTFRPPYTAARMGVIDASPLGKIEVAGPDARHLINKFYVSNLTTLKPGRIRYSVMCHDDGIIFDDAVVTCINDNLFLARHTSGNAETVAAWIERWRQTEYLSVPCPSIGFECTALASEHAKITLLAGIAGRIESIHRCLRRTAAKSLTVPSMRSSKQAAKWRSSNEQ